MKFHPDAALFCVAWIVLAAAGFVLEGWIAGALLSMGILAILMPTSAAIISRTENFALESTVRWSILLGAGTILALVHWAGS